MTKAAIFTFLLAFTLVKPRYSLYLFILISPLVSIYQDISFDPRIWWAACLAGRAAFPFDGAKLRDNWRIVVAAVIFVVYVEIVLLVSSRGISSDELSGAQNALFFVIAGGLFVFAVSRLVDSEIEAIRVVMSLALAGCYVGLYAMWQTWAARAESQPIRPGSTFINPNVLATYLSLMCIVLVVTWKAAGGRWRRIFLAVTIAVAVIGVWLSLSRAGLVALSLSLLLWWVTRNRRVGIPKMLIVIVLCCGSIYGAVTYLRDYRIQIESDYADDEARALTDISQSFDDYSRYQAASYAIAEWISHPIAGIGFGIFAARNYQANGFYVTTHNTLLEILVGTGTAGLLIIAYILQQIWHKLNKISKTLFVPIAACLIASSLFGDLLQEISVIELVTLGYVICMYQGQETPAISTAHAE